MQTRYLLWFITAAVMTLLTIWTKPRYPEVNAFPSTSDGVRAFDHARARYFKYKPLWGPTILILWCTLAVVFGWMQPWRG